MDARHLVGKERAPSHARGWTRARPRKGIEGTVVSGQTYLKPPGSCNTRWGSGVNVEAECCEDCSLYVLDVCEQVQVSECARCRMIIAPTGGSVFLIECVDCVISVAAKQIRLRDCQRCELRVFAPQPAALIIETSSDISVMDGSSSATWNPVMLELSLNLIYAVVEFMLEFESMLELSLY